MTYTEKQLKAVTTWLWEIYSESLPDASAYHPEYSHEFLEKM